MVLTQLHTDHVGWAAEQARASREQVLRSRAASLHLATPHLTEPVVPRRLTRRGRPRRRRAQPLGRPCPIEQRRRHGPTCRAARPARGPAPAYWTAWTG
ncbi:hypothetical protein [Streptomyces anulatus]|uniref:hypothetical protein n=1 Tax=Streptomyces anulatus TaxID=1892 RepID=UPI0038633B9D